MDSNIVISAIRDYHSYKNPNKIFHLNENSIIDIYISEKVIEECRRNIKSKCPTNQENCENIINKCKFLRDIISPFDNIEIASLPPLDKLIVTTAIFNDMDFFLTGNKKDFMSIYGNQYEKTFILSLNDFLFKFNFI